MQTDCRIIHSQSLFFLVCAVLCGLCSSSVADIPDVIYFFDDSGNAMAVDSSGNGLDVRLHRTSIITDEQAKFGTGSLKLAPEGKPLGRGWYNIQKSDALLGGAIKKMTVMCWLRPVDIQKSYPVFRRYERDSDNRINMISLSMIRSILLFSVQAGEKSSTVRSPKNFEALDHEWIHLAATFDEGSVSLYVNGQLVADGEMPDLPEIPAVTEQVAFSGLMEAPTGTFMDDFAIFGRALNQDEIQRIHSNGLKAFLDASGNKQ